MTQRHAGIGRDQLKHLTDRPYPRPLIRQLTMLITYTHCKAFHNSLVDMRI